MEKDPKYPIELIEKSIFLIRDKKVMLDNELAKLYGVEAKVLNQAVKRNMERFPKEFMFQLSKEEYESLRSQIVTLKKTGRGKHRKYLPFVFTEHGAIMLANVLNSKTAIQAGIHVVKAFVKLREMAMSHKDLERKIIQLENKYDKHFKVVFDALRKLITPPLKSKKEIGFRGKDE